jgi:peptidoglycan/xylan/chitin deacetylase (PgdA/CDA1 family)
MLARLRSGAVELRPLLLFQPGMPRISRSCSQIGLLWILPLLVLAGCTAQPPAPSPRLDEEVLGAPLPYEERHPALQTAPTLAPVPAQVVRRVATRKKWVALTFDACATSQPSRFDDRVIRTLIDLNVPATLFLGGKWMEEHPDETAELATYPQFELANHTYLHPHLTRIDNARVTEEIVRTQDILYTLTGQTAHLLRAPYGEVDARVAKLVGEQGLISIQFDLASGDPDPHISTKRLIDYVSDMTRGGSVVVMHMNGHGWRTAEALPRIILRLRKKGYKFVTVSTLLSLQPNPPPVPGKKS